MLGLELETESKEIVAQQLERLNMWDYQEQVEQVMMGRASPGMILRLINTFYVTGYMRGRGGVQAIISQRVRDSLGRRQGGNRSGH